MGCYNYDKQFPVSIDYFLFAAAAHGDKRKLMNAFCIFFK